jgi:hypothetical protein
MIIQTERDTAPLLERIAKIEQRIYTRRHLLAVRSSGLMQNTRTRMRYNLTSPFMLILAAATGFMAQRWVKRNFSRSPEEVELRRQQRIAKREKKLGATRRKRATDKSSGILARGLKVIALVRTFIAEMPTAWVNALPGILRIKAASGQQSPTAQSPASVSPRARYDGGIKAR